MHLKPCNSRRWAGNEDQVSTVASSNIEITEEEDGGILTHFVNQDLLSLCGLLINSPLILNPDSQQLERTWHILWAVLHDIPPPKDSKVLSTIILQRCCTYEIKVNSAAVFLLSFSLFRNQYQGMCWEKIWWCFQNSHYVNLILKIL